MDLLKTFKTNKDREQNGVWVLMDDQKSRLKIARWGNQRFKDAMQRKMQRYQMAARAKTIPDEMYRTMLNEVIQDTILLDWENMTWGNEPFAYTPEHVLQALELDDFRNEVTGFAQDMANFKEELDEGTEKNSGRP